MLQILFSLRGYLSLPLCRISMGTVFPGLWITTINEQLSFLLVAQFPYINDQLTQEKMGAA